MKKYLSYINLIVNVNLAIFFFIAANLFWDDIADESTHFLAVIGTCLCGLIAAFLYIFDLYLVIKDFKFDLGDEEIDDSA